MSFKLRITTNALKDIRRHKLSGDRNLIQKIGILLDELKEHPRTGTGHPEQLKYDLKGLYSRRINSKHRMIYDIRYDIVTVIILSAYAHYGDK